MDNDGPACRKGTQASPGATTDLPLEEESSPRGKTAGRSLPIKEAKVTLGSDLRSPPYAHRVEFFT